MCTWVLPKYTSTFFLYYKRPVLNCKTLVLFKIFHDHPKRSRFLDYSAYHDSIIEAFIVNVIQFNSKNHEQFSVTSLKLGTWA